MPNMRRLILFLLLLIAAMSLSKAQSDPRYNHPVRDVSRPAPDTGLVLITKYIPGSGIPYFYYIAKDSIGSPSQSLSINGNQLTISDGNTVTIPAGGDVTTSQLNDSLQAFYVYYDNIDSLRNETELSVGDIAITKGYYTPGDSGPSVYIVQSTPVSGYTTDDNAVIQVGSNYAVISNLEKPEQLGARGDGLTNDQDAFTDLANFLRATGGFTVKLAPNTSYLLNNDVTNDFSNLQIIGENSTLICGNAYSGFKEFINVRGAVGTYYDFTSDANSGQYTFSVSGADAANFSPGDLVKIQSDEIFNADYNSPEAGTFTIGTTKGEMKRVNSIAGGTLSFENVMFDDYKQDSARVAVVSPASFSMTGVTITTSQNFNSTNIGGIEIEYTENVNISNCIFEGFKTNVLIANSYNAKLNLTDYSYQAPDLLITAACAFVEISGTLFFSNSEVEVIGGSSNTGGGTPWAITFKNLEVIKDERAGEVLDTHHGTGSVVYENVTVSGGSSAFSQGARYITIKDCKVNNATRAFQTRDEDIDTPTGDYRTLPVKRLTISGLIATDVNNFAVIKQDVDELKIENCEWYGTGRFIDVTSRDNYTSFNTFDLIDNKITDLFITGAFKVPIMNISGLTAVEDSTYTSNGVRWIWFQDSTQIRSLFLDGVKYYRRNNYTDNGDLFYIQNDANIGNINLLNSKFDIINETADTDRRFFFSNSSYLMPDINISNTEIIDTNGYYRLFFANGDNEGFIRISNSKILRNSASYQFGMTDQIFFNNGNVFNENLDVLIGSFIKIEVLSGSVNQEGNSFSGAILRGDGDPNGAISADIGTLFFRSNGGSSTTMYVKESGNNTNTGWVAK